MNRMVEGALQGVLSRFQSPEEQLHVATREWLRSNFEAVAVPIPQVLQYPDGSRYSKSEDVLYLGYRLKPGKQLDSTALDRMRSLGITPEALYTADTAGTIYKAHLKDGAEVNARKATGEESKKGNLNLGQLRVSHESSEFRRLGDPASGNANYISTLGKPTEVVVRSSFILPAGSANLRPSTLAQRYHLVGVRG